MTEITFIESIQTEWDKTVGGVGCVKHIKTVLK